MAILFQTAKLKSANTQFGGKTLNLMTANISGYTVYCATLNDNLTSIQSASDVDLLSVRR